MTERSVLELSCPKCKWKGHAGQAISHKYGYDCPNGHGRIHNLDGSPIEGPKESAPKASGGKSKTEAAGAKE